MLTVYITLPLYVYCKTMRKFEELAGKEMVQSVGAFYEGKAIKRGRKVLFHPVSFLLRRLILVYLVVGGTDELIYQMMILMGSSICSAIIVYQTDAFQLPQERRLSTFSEFVILFLSYCFFSFDLLDVESNF